MNEIDKLVDGLNEQQKEAVTTTEGYVRVIAGAGSGKTRALTTRYAYIVEALGINSTNILCVTFTNKAAGEMRKRVKKIIGEDSDVSYIATYHGFCVRIIREEFNKIQYPKDFIIMDTEDQKTVLRDIFNELGLTSKVFTHKQVLAYIGKQKVSLDYLDYLLENKKVDSSNQIEQVFYRYLDKQKRNFALDFNDLINIAIYILSNNPDVLEKWQRRLHYILIDETQDSSQKQFSLVNMLAGFHKNLFVVGDPDQTIYEWRGAKPEILVDFDQQFPDAKTIIMNENYRSTPNILTLGNTLIKKNKIRVDKDMVTQNKPGIDVVHFHGGNELEESLWVANEIKRIVKKGKWGYSDFAILYRAGHVSRSIEQTFVRENIPYSVFGGIRFFERKEIKDTLSYLRLIEKGDDLSFLRVIGTPRRGLGKKFVENVARVAIENDTSLLEALESNIELESLNRPGSIEFIEMIKKFRILRETLTVSDLIKEILDITGLTVMYRAEGDTDRLDNIKELQNSIILLETEQQERVDLSEYLQEIALYTNMDIDSDTDQRVKLMTIHTSKGLEFPHVFLCGFTEGIIPSAMSLKERRAKALEEERRLAYVAITRAEKSFYMTESEGYNFSTESNKYPSRFLFEISEDHFVRKGTLNKELIEEAKEFLINPNSSDSEYEIFNSGDVVQHKIWGKGKVLEVNKDKGEYQIEFIETAKIKPINFEFKGLELVQKSSEELEEQDQELEEVEVIEMENDQEPKIEKKIKAKIKRFAKKEYPDDKEMRAYEYNNQVESFLHMQTATDLEVKEFAIKEYKHDYCLQQSIYDESVPAKKYMTKVKDSEVKAIALKAYPLDYVMQKVVYDQQLESKKYMTTVTDSEIKAIAIKAYPLDYDMQKFVYDQQLEAKKKMLKFENNNLRKKAASEYPNDYDMQVYIYKELATQLKKSRKKLKATKKNKRVNKKESIIEHPIDEIDQILRESDETLDDNIEDEIDQIIDEYSNDNEQVKNTSTIAPNKKNNPKEKEKNNLWSKLKRFWS